MFVLVQHNLYAIFSKVIINRSPRYLDYSTIVYKMLTSIKKVFVEHCEIYLSSVFERKLPPWGPGVYGENRSLVSSCVL